MYQLQTIHNQQIPDHTLVETPMGVGRVFAFHSLTGSYSINISGRCEWFSPDEMEILQCPESTTQPVTP